VWLVGRRPEALADVATTARAAAARVEVHPADLTRDSDIQEVRAALERAGGRLDLLVHCAGAIVQGPLEHARIEDFDAQYRSNVRAPYLLTQTLLPLLRGHRGDIVFINSSVGMRARAEVGQFAATQFALKAVADTLREEVNTQGVRVLSVFPGRTATPRQATIHAEEGKDYRPEQLIQPEQIATMVVSAVELPQTAEVTEISVRPFIKPPL
jgi:NADP-dependent 3-hydroxy acid dehydrogenase YdfG